MERLSFASKFTYNATEAAIHLARYQLAIPYCKGKRVLDVACGEGYGAHVLKHHGASAVDAVDNSPQAISNAERLFSASGVRFHLHDAEDVSALFAGQTFDLIVSLETIEHLRDPKRFLRSIKALMHGETITILSCPNDHWYYSDSRSSPFHLAKYSYEEFRELTEGMLGSATTWGYGVPVLGFGTTTDDLTSGKDATAGQIAMLDFRAQAAAIIVPPRGFSEVGPRNCSYFVGIWGGDSNFIHTSAVAPVSMDYYANLSSWENAGVSVTALNAELAKLRQENQRLELQIGQQKSERDAEANRLHAELEEYQAALDRQKQRADAAQVKLDDVASENEKRRVQVLALSKELQIVGEQMERRTAEHKLIADELARSSEALRSERALSSEAMTSERARAEERIGRLQSATDALHEKLAQQQERLGQQQEKLDQIDAIAADANRYRVQAFALTREFELLSQQVPELRAQRDAVTGQLQAARTQIEQSTEDSARAAHEIDRLTEDSAKMAQEIDRLTEDSARKDGLRYMIGILPALVRQRAVARFKRATRAAGRRVKPYLPAPVLSAAQRLARAFSL